MLDLGGRTLSNHIALRLAGQSPGTRGQARPIDPNSKTIVKLALSPLQVERARARIGPQIIAREETIALGDSLLLTTLPATLHAGAAYYFRRWGSAADFIQGFQNGFGVSTSPELRTGVEYRAFTAFAVRGGLRCGGKQGLGTALGMGLQSGAFDLDLAANAWSGKGRALAIGMRVGL